MKMIKKVLSLALALVMAMSLSVSAFATGPVDPTDPEGGIMPRASLFEEEAYSTKGTCRRFLQRQLHSLLAPE